MRQLLIILSLTIFLSSCELFNTRDPEPPDGSREGFQPPTSAKIVIDNFINAIENKNSSNYRACFADTTQGDPRDYYFISSSDAYSQYPTTFDEWTAFSEEQFFQSMLSILSDDSSPKLTLKNRSTFDVLLKDSAVLITEYQLEIEHNSEGLENLFGGTMQFTLYPNENNFWSIQRWSDNKQTSYDETEATWSILKARMINK